MFVKTTRCFYDVKEDCYRKEGDIFEVSKARFDDLNAKVKGFVVEVEDSKEEKKEAPKK